MFQIVSVWFQKVKPLGLVDFVCYAPVAGDEDDETRVAFASAPAAVHVVPEVLKLAVAVGAVVFHAHTLNISFRM